MLTLSYLYFIIIGVPTMFHGNEQGTLNSYLFRDFVELLENGIFRRVLSVFREFALRR